MIAGLVRLQDLVRAPPELDMEVYIRQALPEEYRDVLREIKNKDIRNIVVDTKPENIQLFLRSDTETFDLEDFRYNRVNMTGYRLVDTSSGLVQASLASMEQFQPVSSVMVPATNVIKAETALIYDAVNAFAHGLHALTGAGRVPTPNVTCDLLNTWNGGLQLYERISAVQMPGLTGPIQFSGGRRTRLKLDLMKLTTSGMKKVGWWSDRTGINVTDSSAFYGTDLPNVTLLVSTIQVSWIEKYPWVYVETSVVWYKLSEEQDKRYGVKDPVTGEWDGMVKKIIDKERPFMMLKPAENGSEPQFEGFCVDLLERVAELVGFQYRIELAPDSVFGYQDAVTGEWDGLVRRLIDKVPNSQPTRLFSFMNPLAVEIWLYVMAAYMVVSFTMFVMARFSPYEWNNPHPCFDDNDVVENQFSVSNSFWFITGTLLRQGSGLNPKAASTRIVGSIWWFFTLIIISSYTANLAAFLTVERTSTPIESAADLAKQEDIEYGTLEGGSTMTFFRDSKIETYQKMWKFMESRKPSVFVPNYEEGVQRVLKGNYAFLMESTLLDYIVQRNCNLTQVGGLLDSKGYGIAMPVGSPWRDKISLAILDLQEKGVIQMLYNKWWKDTGDVCSRDEKKKDSKASPLGIANIGQWPRAVAVRAQRTGAAGRRLF
ncbi:Glutamate receptor ionotropic, kainate 2 [Amphibalanus amphitrite]|uniref:Glutamate receptor ionotropic, kainate 2 n=1 Tax=Amphibalanus amphitrite TaxID=1232801 RepID=A0A6A4VFF1_AMPAM|nr:Glutamate receptor ionotropic, kainate 2 [Amphibalanus amphitrite]